MANDDYVLNEHNKEEFPPAHTAEHLLNQTMIRLFGCERSYNAHIERKKSKMSFRLDHKPSRQDEKEIEREMQRLIDEDLPVTFDYIGDYDVCPCIGKHVRSTAQIGRFEMLGTNWDEHEHSFRVRFKIVQ